ncbi:MAG TPA: methyl-accepting chemotaxis protein [Opitutaceae bacterium]|nr:methyl-accepting chemotaxis protein [Opitutaceae bacterium]
MAVSLKDMARIAGAVNDRLTEALLEISSINFQTRLLSFNAQLEASRAGEAGRAFDVVAREMVALSDRTGSAARRLEGDTNADLSDLAGRINAVGTEVRGARLSDLAFTNMDLIDRNLYERSCDVRWWATDSSCVLALLDPEGESERACQRLGVILDAYTVYYDIVLCDRSGNVVANGRPGRFRCQGTNQSSTPWFKSAMATRRGDEFGFAGLHRSHTLANNQMVLVYSAAVRRDGQADGEIVGCLGIVFNWEALAQTIVLRTQLGEAEKKHTRVCIVDAKGGMIADNRLGHLRDEIPLSSFARLIECKKGYVVTEFEGNRSIVAYAYSPGYETYATGWHSFIIQDLEVD